MPPPLATALLATAALLRPCACVGAVVANVPVRTHGVRSSAATGRGRGALVLHGAHCRCGVPSMISKEDAESNARLVSALFESVEDASRAIEKSKDVSSHLQLDYDEDGRPTQLRFVYVDEISCIGCTYCAQVARNTFFMHDAAGRARAFAQGQDDPELVMEAIDSCPVNCISFVDYEDLVILETERDGQVINQASIGVPATWSVSMNALPPTKAKLGGSGSLTCCNNCPSRGCKECPMYGIGQNPVYQKRLQEREQRRRDSGEAQREVEDGQKAEKVDSIFAQPIGLPLEDPVGVVEPTLDVSGGDLSIDVLACLYDDDPYNLDDDEGDQLP